MGERIDASVALLAFLQSRPSGKATLDEIRSAGISLHGVTRLGRAGVAAYCDFQGKYKIATAVQLLRHLDAPVNDREVEHV